METNWRRIIIYLLIFLTIAAIIVAVILSLNLTPGTPTPTPTPNLTFTATPTTTGTGTNTDPDTCAGKGSVRTSIKCRKDDSSVCASTTGSDAVQNIMVGQEVCADGNIGKCDFYAACAPAVTEGESCAMQYPGINEPIQSLSDQISSNGAFVGCDINNQINNCYCQVDSSNNLMSTANVTCFEDQRVNGNYNFCGARTFSGGTATPTATPSITASVTGSPTTTVTVTSSIDACPTAPACTGGNIRVTPSVTAGSCPTFVCVPGSITATPTSTIPVTAITSSDETDRILFGMILIISSLLLYYFELHTKIGRSIAQLLPGEVFGGFEKIKREELKSKKSKFESKITKNSN